MRQAEVVGTVRLLSESDYVGAKQVSQTIQRLMSIIIMVLL